MDDKGNRYIVTVDGVEFDMVLSQHDDHGKYKLDYNGKTSIVRAYELSPNKYLLKIDGMSSEVDISRSGKKLDVFLEGKEMTSTVEPYFLAQLRKQAGESSDGPADKTVIAPMPGLVLSIEAKPGQSVSKGDTLCIIEAMKMENLIKSPLDAIVQEVFVNPGNAVEKGEKLFELDS